MPLRDCSLLIAVNLQDDIIYGLFYMRINSKMHNHKNMTRRIITNCITHSRRALEGPNPQHCVAVATQCKQGERYKSCEHLTYCTLHNKEAIQVLSVPIMQWYHAYFNFTSKLNCLCLV
jgi:hypothetical protein